MRVGFMLLLFLTFTHYYDDHKIYFYFSYDITPGMYPGRIPAQLTTTPSSGVSQ